MELVASKRSKVKVGFLFKPQSIAIIGTGYVGLTSGACLADLGHRVTCVDKDISKIAAIQQGMMPIYEPGLAEIVQKNVKFNRLYFSTDTQTEVAKNEYVFLCLPTPAGADGSTDLSVVVDVITEIIEYIRPGTIVINKSTVPVGTTQQIGRDLLAKNVNVVSNPEFLREGNAIQDFLQPDRIVIGAQDDESALKVANLYSGVNAPILITDTASSECIKYMANAFLAMKLSYVNQIARFCDAVDADVQDVLNGLSLDDRIGSKFLQPGPGWGGSCFPKDTKALVAHGESIGAPMSMIQEAIRANEEHMSLIGNLIAQAASQQSLTDPKIAILGLAFKANTDDVRDSPAVKIADALSQTYSNIAVYDPMAKLDSGLSKFRSDDLDTTILNADVIAILTEWDEFSQLSPEYLRNLMRGKHIVDARYILELNQFQDSSFQVRVLGKSR